jgi:hypothetical protein
MMKLIAMHSKKEEPMVRCLQSISNQHNLEREKALARNQSIIHDQTHLTLKSRSRSIFNVPDNYYKIAIVCSVPEDVRQQRLLGRPGKIIPVEADERMVSSFIHPEIDEGFYDGVYAVGQAMRVLMPYLIRRN